ncbi:HD domain-containing protein [Staphylococcus ratti]|uniref:HD domain-containing protein n=1 Tax=Staphylococcus ratti TaxID=2892440 RepID=A0ABY3PEG0_9STAP|nr:HD domain-containing protein [Staphylococcus ratti]UEX90705.1 HD domain-containing protein [Staphylococcus ratti]
MKEKQCQLAHHYMENVHAKDSSGHDCAHVRRVVALAKTIAKDYAEANLFVIEMAALLHDTVDDKIVHATHQEALTQFLTDIHVSEQDQQHILYIITHMSFRKSKDGTRLKSIEAQIVQDADRLDAIGAIGIARTFQFAGHFHEPMWTGEKTMSEMEGIDLNTLPPSAIKHFYEKLIKLKDLMNTPKALALAEERHAFLKLFLQQFFDEWV